MNDPRREASAMLEGGRAAEAFRFLSEATRQATGDRELLMLLGISAFRLQDWVKAETVFREVVAAEPDHHLAVYYVGLTLERQGKQAEALRMFRTSLALRPDFAKAREKIAAASGANSVLTGVPQADERTRAPSLSTLVDQGEPSNESSLSGNLLFSGRRRFSSFLERILVLVPLLVGCVLPFGILRVMDRGAHQQTNETNQEMMRLKSSMLEQEERKARFVDELKRLESTGGSSSARARVRMEIDRIAFQIRADESRLRSLSFRDDVVNRNRASGREAGSAILLLVAVASFLLAMLLLVDLALAYAGTRYDLFERRVDIRSGGLLKRLDSVWHYEITETTLGRSPLLALTGSSSIRLRTDRGRFEIVGVADAATMERLWRGLRDAVLRERRDMKKTWI